MKLVLLLALVVVVVKCEQNCSDHERPRSHSTCEAQVSDGLKAINVVVEVSIPAVQPLQQSILGTTQNMPAGSCKEITTLSPGAASGYYWILTRNQIAPQC